MFNKCFCWSVSDDAVAPPARDILCPCAPLDASIGENGHQRHKRSNVSGSGRDPAAHHARRVNTLLALRRLMAPGESWLATGFDRSRKETRTAEERAGKGCSRVLSSLDGYLRGGLECPTEADEHRTSADRSALRGQFQGSAVWDAVICRPTGSEQEGFPQTDDPEGWKTAVAQSGIVPHEESVLRTADLWYGCHRQADEGDSCSDKRCPACWEGSRLLQSRVRCSRFKHNVSSRASSRLGRFKGGNVRHARIGGPFPRAWAVGADSGDDVEIFKSPVAQRQGLTGDSGVTLAKILYFFDVEGNRRVGEDGVGPPMEYVLVYEYVTCGPGRIKKGDKATDHPTFFLQGRPGIKPSVFPVDAIRRHVHMYHACPLSSFETAGGGVVGAGATGSEESRAESQCGLHRVRDCDGGGLVWEHYYELAKPGNSIRQRDTYILNEHWHSAWQDGIV